MSTPFSELAADWLLDLGMRVWKVASGEITNLPLIDKMSSAGGPVILSSGMSDFEELDVAVGFIKERGNPLAVLQCTTAYPCPAEKVGLNVLTELNQRYDVPVGLSDHSGKIYAGLAAAAYGAEVVEVHVALSREMFGPDVVASITTTELKQLTEGVREIGAMLSAPVDKKAAAASLDDVRRLFTKSIFAGEALEAGTKIERSHLKLKKPGTGLSPSQICEVIGKTLKVALAEDDPILHEHLI
jgi:N-acetylneuraminate synthase